jgi:hypothetical protein
MLNGPVFVSFPVVQVRKSLELCYLIHNHSFGRYDLDGLVKLAEGLVAESPEKGQFALFVPLKHLFLLLQGHVEGIKHF